MVFFQEHKVAEAFLKDLRAKATEQQGRRNAAARRVIDAQRAVDQIQHQQRGEAFTRHTTACKLLKELNGRLFSLTHKLAERLQGS